MAALTLTWFPSGSILYKCLHREAVLGVAHLAIPKFSAALVGQERCFRALLQSSADSGEGIMCCRLHEFVEGARPGNSHFPSNKLLESPTAAAFAAAVTEQLKRVDAELVAVEACVASWRDATLLRLECELQVLVAVARRWSALYILVKGGVMLWGHMMLLRC